MCTYCTKITMRIDLVWSASWILCKTFQLYWSRPFHSVLILYHATLTRLGVDDLDSCEDEDDYAASERNSGTPSTCPSTVPSCSSTQVEPSTSNESLHNRCCMDTGGDTTTHPKTLEAQANNDELGRGDQTKVVQEETALSQTASQAKVQSKENQDEDAGNMSQEKVCEKITEQYPCKDSHHH